MSLLIAGSTGAIGREVVKAALSEPRLTRIVALSRRNINPEQYATVFGSDIDVTVADGRLQVVAIDWEKLTDDREAYLKAAPELKLALEGHQFVFNGMGTTRAEAGSADAFKRVDLDYSKALVDTERSLCSGNAQHYAQISAEYAKDSSWFLYNQVKGQTDTYVMNAGFSVVSVYRPGLLERGDKMRGIEKLAKVFMTAIAVSSIARCVVARYFMDNLPPSTILYNKEILEVAEPQKTKSACCKSSK